MNFDFLGSVLVTGAKTVAAAGTAVQLAAPGAQPNCFQVTIIAQKAGRAANTGTVYLGLSGASNAQLFPLAPGAALTVSAPHQHQFDLSKIYVDATTSGDGVVFFGSSQANG